MANVNGTVYFSASNSTSGRELWRTDGTAAGTVAIPDIDAGTASSDPQGFVNVNGKIVFSGTSDGNTQGTDRDVYSVPEQTGAIQNQTGNFRLTIYVNDTQVTIPANVRRIISGGTSAAITSTDATGDLSFNSQNTPTVGDFFNIWQTNGGEGGNNANSVLTTTDLLGNKTDSTHTYTDVRERTDFDLVREPSNPHRGPDCIGLRNESGRFAPIPNFGPIVMELYQNQSTVAGKTTPLTVANFLAYVDSGAFTNTFFNRSGERFRYSGWWLYNSVNELYQHNTICDDSDESRSHQ